MTAEQLAQQTRARLVLPSVHIYERGVCIFDTSRDADSASPPDEYIPSWLHVTRTATVPYLCGPRGLVAVLRAGHHSARRM